MCLYRISLCAYLACAGSTAFAWNLIRDVEHAVRTVTVAPVAQLIGEADKASVAVAAAKVSAVPPAQLSELEKRQRAAEVAVLEEERKIRVRVEERALVALEEQLKNVRSVPYKIDRIALTAISNVLYRRDLEIQPMVYENFVFLHIEPKKIAVDEGSEVHLRLVVYWDRNGDRLSMRYAAVEKRLRVAEPRLSADPRIVGQAAAFVGELAKALERKGVQ